jgi:adenine-specific DNA-methyltransferase
MPDLQSTQPELFDVAELPGRPMLHWHGKRPLREVPYYPAQLRERYGSGEPPDGWVNRLYWGDNLQVMAHLMREFRGKIRLIYIDPPFDSGADYRKRVRLRGTSVEADLGVLEERQYTDIWSNDLYLQYMYERLILMRELLAEDGSVYVHCDARRSHHLRCMMDEIFGESCFCNHIIWSYRRWPSVSSKYQSMHDDILFYCKNPQVDRVFHTEYEEPSESYLKRFKGKTQVLDEETGTRKITVDEETKGLPMRDVWEISILAGFKAERTRFPTQKPEELLHRIIWTSSDPGDLVADFFVGSGTTAAVAQRLGRRWIGADINLGVIHTTAQRLARIIAEQRAIPHQPELFTSQDGTRNTPYAVFQVYNVNHYEVFKNAEEARDIVLQLYGVEPLRGHRFFDGVLDGRWVKVIDLNRICSRLDIQTIFDNLPPDDTRGVVVLCAGHEYDVPEVVKQRNLFNIPFEVRDILTDRKDVIFKRPPEAQVSLSRVDGRFTLAVEQFYSPLLLQKLSLEDDPEAIEDWRQMVASVLIDPAYDGEVFHPRITDTPARQGELVRGEYTWNAGEYVEGRSVEQSRSEVAVKIVDVLDEEWFGVVGRGEADDGEVSGTSGSLRDRYRDEVERVVAILQERYEPDKIILFGSCSRGDFGEDSDIDLLIVKETSKRPLDRMREVYELVYTPDRYLALDPLIYTPMELTQRLASGDFFVREILSEGKVLYERE